MDSVSNVLKELDSMYLYVQSLRRKAEEAAQPMDMEVGQEQPDAEQPAVSQAVEPAAAIELVAEDEPCTGRGLLHSGSITILVKIPASQYKVKKLITYLRRFPVLSLIWEYWSVGKGTEILLSVSEPAPILDILRGNPLIDRIYDRGKEIQVTLTANQEN